MPHFAIIAYAGARAILIGIASCCSGSKTNLICHHQLFKIYPAFNAKMITRRRAKIAGGYISFNGKTLRLIVSSTDSLSSMKLENCRQQEQGIFQAAGFTFLFFFLEQNMFHRMCCLSFLRAELISRGISPEDRSTIVLKDSRVEAASSIVVFCSLQGSLSSSAAANRALSDATHVMLFFPDFVCIFEWDKNNTSGIFRLITSPLVSFF